MAVQSQPAVRPRWRIAPPAPGQGPLKVNLFAQLQAANTTLLPLFPYLGEGAIVPCGAIFCGGPGRAFGHFFHTNPLDEVVLILGARGGTVEAGDVHVLAKTHGVRPSIKDPTDPDSYLIACITQREAPDAPGYGREALTFRCRQCSEILLRCEYAAEAVPPLAARDPATERYPTFATIVGTLQAAENFNADEARRTCPKCGTLNAPFPMRTWSRYVAQTRTANAARHSLDAAARAALADGSQS